MISFTNNEILLSLGYAAGYGVAYSALYSLMLLLRAAAFGSADISTQIFSFERIFPLPSFTEHIRIGKVGRVFAFLSVIFFALGFIVVSYFALDGVIRIYMLIIAFASFYLSKFAFFDFLNKALIWIFDKILRAFCLALRLLIYPFKHFIRRNKVLK